MQMYEPCLEMNYDNCLHASITCINNLRPWVRVTKSLLIVFSMWQVFKLVKAPVRFFESHSYLTGVTAAKLCWHLSNMNMIFNTSVPHILEKWENNKTQKTGLVTPPLKDMDTISMAQCKKYVTPLLTHWSYVFLSLTYRFSGWHLWMHFLQLRSLNF